MDTLSFTSRTRRRVPQPVDVDFCGDTFTVQRPKDSVLYFSEVITADSVSDADRAMGILQFINSTLDPAQQHRFFARCTSREDPVNLTATLDLIGQLRRVWYEWPTTDQGDPRADHQPDTVVVEATGTAITGNPVRTPIGRVPEEDGDDEAGIIAYPPKDIVLAFVGAAVATNTSVGQQAWAIGTFLDAAFNQADGLAVSYRMRSRDDDLDLADIVDIVAQLVERWRPTGNRAERRAAAKQGG